MRYTERDLVALAKRENNQKRSYLVVDPLQGKHVPVRPAEALKLFGSLAELLQEAYGRERLLLVGFAETATAIGAAAAVKLGAAYIHTTRERTGEEACFYFSEQHSHATEQKLVRTGFDRIVERTDRIVFIEDEITTGNTIRNLVRLLKEAYPGRLAYAAASLLNGMDEAHRRQYEEEGIRLHWLVKTCHDAYEGRAAGCREDGVYYGCETEEPEEKPEEYRIPGHVDTRRLTDGQAYGAACEELCRRILRIRKPEPGRRVLVVGTEEFMYPSLLLGSVLEEAGVSVRCHSTTRSPIAVSADPSYPLHARYELASLYDSRRKTFLYDLAAYDEVLVVTDAGDGEQEGLYSLVHALCSCGNQKISVFRWYRDEKLI